MLIEFVKKHSLNQRLLEPGYLIDTDKMDLINEEAAQQLIEAGIAKLLDGDTAISEKSLLADVDAEKPDHEAICHDD